MYIFSFFLLNNTSIKQQAGRFLSYAHVYASTYIPSNRKPVGVRFIKGDSIFKVRAVRRGKIDPISVSWLV